MADRIYDERSGAMRSAADMAADPSRKKVAPKPAKPSMGKVKYAETKAKLKNQMDRSRNTVSNNIAAGKKAAEKATSTRDAREAAKRVSNAVGSVYDPKSPAGKMKQAEMAKAVKDYKKPKGKSARLHAVQSMLGNMRANYSARGGRMTGGAAGGGMNVNDLNK